jgi:glutathione peroxidase-family protein
MSPCGFLVVHRYDVLKLSQDHSEAGYILLSRLTEIFKQGAVLIFQFKAQEPGTDDEVLQFCQRNYGVSFPIAKKVSLAPLHAGLCTEMTRKCLKRANATQADVNGPETQPIWAYLKENAEEPVKDIDWVSCNVSGLQ